MLMRQLSSIQCENVADSAEEAQIFGNANIVRLAMKYSAKA